MYGISNGTNCQNTKDYSTSVGYSAQSALGATSLGYSAKASGTFAVAIGYNATTSQGIAIGGQCNNTTANYIKFWIGNDSTTSTLAGVQFGNIILGVSGSNLTIKNATSFDVRPTLKNVLSALTNNNDIATKQYVDIVISFFPTPDLSDYAKKDEIPDLTNYLTTEDIYVQPQLPPIDGEPVNRNDSLLVTKNMWMIYLIHFKIHKFY
jgi:hypothetical protein